MFIKQLTLVGLLPDISPCGLFWHSKPEETIDDEELSISKMG